MLPPQVLDPLAKAALQAAFPCTDPDDEHVVAMAKHQQELSDDAARASILRSTLLPDALSDERDKELHMKESKEKMDESKEKMDEYEEKMAEYRVSQRTALSPVSSPGNGC